MEHPTGSVSMGEGALQQDSRRCSYCLTEVPVKEVKICSRCHRRAYCGKECQVKDWKSKMGTCTDLQKLSNPSQGHKDWCGIPCLEEGMDWEVKKVLDVTLGVFAKTAIPKWTRIIIDGRSDNEEHGLSHEMTKLPTGFVPNADSVLDVQYGVLIIIANRDIPAGERICSKDLGVSGPLEENGRMFINGNPGKKEAVAQFQGLKEEVRRLHNSSVHRFVQASILRRAFIYGLFRKETIPKALEYGEQGCDILASIGHPKGRNVTQMIAWVKNAEKIHKSLKAGKYIKDVLIEFERKEY